MEKHIFEDRSRPYTFLPINVGARATLPYLAVVDTCFAETHPSLHTCLWRSTKSGSVARQFIDRQHRGESGQKIRVSEQLIHVVMGKPPFTPSYAANGDPLDCRADNLKLAEHTPAQRVFAAQYRPGQVVSTLPGYNDALNELRAWPGLYEATLNRKRTTKLSSAQVLLILNAALSGPIKGQTIESITGYVAEEMGVQLHANQIRAIILGQCLPQYGFDYAALKATRLSPRERALERWKQRQAK
jgi:hypothetical protein